MNNIIDCDQYKKNFTLERNKNNIQIINKDYISRDIGKNFYNKPYKITTSKKILPFLKIGLEHDYMWFSRHNRKLLHLPKIDFRKY